MSSHYFAIGEDGATSCLEKEMLEMLLNRDMRVMRSYSRHGRHQRKVVQITCDTAVEEEFLSAMRG